MSEQVVIGRLATIDEELDILDRLIESGQVDHMITVVAQTDGSISLCSHGTPLGTVEAILEAALKSVRGFKSGKAHRPGKG